MAYVGNQARVKILKGEHAGKLATVQSQIQKRYTRERDTYRVLIDGFPIPGGWNGIEIMTADFFELVK